MQKSLFFEIRKRKAPCLSWLSIQPDYENRVFDHIAFEVDDMYKTIKAMRIENVTITDEPFKLSSTSSLIAFVEDPDGTLIELIERKQNHKKTWVY